MGSAEGMPTTAERGSDLSGAERTPPAPQLPGFVREPTAALWGALSALRGKRIFHPDGVAYEAELHVHGEGEPTGAPLLDVPGRHTAVVRASRGAGLPEGLPDTLGLGIRVCDAHGEGRHQDVLVNVSANLPLLHHLILPAWDGFFGQTYSSVLPYRIGGRLVLVGAIPAAAERRRGRGALPELEELAALGEAAFDLALASVGGRWQAPWGRLRLTARLNDRVAEALRFNPWHTGGGIRPAGPLQGIRGAAYRGSQRGSGRGGA
jgi:hypothetical protein